MTTFRHHPLIGTTVEVRVLGRDDDEASRIDRLAVSTMMRLQGVFNAFDPHSELERWKRDELEDPSPELAEVLNSALDWQTRSAGRFNPLAGVLTAAWRAAEVGGRLPDPIELASLADSIAEPRYHRSAGVPVRVGDCTDLNLNAIAKGYIVDRALDAIAGAGATVVVNAGGDLAHRGDEPVEVGVENPLRPFDNEPPLTRFELVEAAVATSGGARRGFSIDGRRYSHVIDPRTGMPADQVASITVLAADAITADVVATVLGVIEPGEAVAEAEGLGVECLVVAPDGTVMASPGFSAG